MKISSYDVLPISDSKKFEEFCYDLWRATWLSHTVQRNGREGQQQSGVDIFGVPVGSQRYQGVQCKCRSSALGSKLTEQEIHDEVKKAKKFQPQLEHLIIATTAHSDTHLQAIARAITMDNAAADLFSVSVLGWKELLVMLDEHDEVAKKYYPNMFSSDSLSKKREALLVEENPTRIEVKGLHFMSFLGDHEPYLTLEVENVSKLIAKDVKLSILLPVKEGQTQSEIAVFTPSMCMDINATPNFSIPGGTSQHIPFAPQSEAHETLSREFNSYRLVGVGLSPEIPSGELTQLIRERDPLVHLPRISLQALGFGISLKWSSIFEQEMTKVLGAFLYLWDEGGDMRYAEKTT